MNSLHTSGEQLDQYTGIAAILRFPLITEQTQLREQQQEQQLDHNATTSTTNASSVNDAHVFNSSHFQQQHNGNDGGGGEMLDRELEDAMSFF